MSANQEVFFNNNNFTTAYSRRGERAKTRSRIFYADLQMILSFKRYCSHVRRTHKYIDTQTQLKRDCFLPKCLHMVIFCTLVVVIIIIKIIAVAAISVSFSFRLWFYLQWRRLH